MGYEQKLLPLRKQGEVQDRWLTARLDKILPDLMKEAGIDMWIVFSQENNEDSVMKTLLPSPLRGSLRRTLLLFFRREDGSLEKLSLGRPGVVLDKVYKSVWNNQADSDWSKFAALSPNKVRKTTDERPPETQVECLKRIIDEFSPKKIGLNYSQNNAYGDGISHGLYSMVIEGIGAENAAKIVSAEGLCVRWLETRLPEEIEAMKGIVGITAEVLQEALSTKVIHPGVTTAGDLEWWTVQRCFDLGLDPWFHFSATVRRKGENGISGGVIIQGGDIVCIDMGVHYLGLCTDIKGNAYVLKHGEKEAPAGIVKLLDQGTRLQDIMSEEIRAGRTGNDVLATSLTRAEKEGINAMVYAHPIGFYGHGAGPTIGLVDNQKFLKVRGEAYVNNNTCFAMEFNVSANIPEWDGSLLTMDVETDVVYTGGKIEFFHRQGKLYIV